MCIRDRSSWMRPLRKSGTGLLIFIVFLLCATAQKLVADVIYLNDGTVLLVEKAWIEGEEVKYQTSRGLQSLPKSRVREIQAENLPPAPKTPQRWSLANIVSGSGTATPTGTPPDSVEFSAETLKKLRQN